MVTLLLILFGAAVFLVLLYAGFIQRLLSLTQGLVKIFSKVTALLGDNKIKNERGSKYYMEIVPLLLLLLDAGFFLLLLFDASVQE